jgi:uncharacterized protein YyaL (SSP411 family)
MRQHPANRLANESSLYLRQHANNPVDWYPWGEEALRRARDLQRPIFLSVGYSACHWCHVMEHESFENPDIAAILNEHFVSIKIDREERPDLDHIYMTAVQMLNQGQGGWPMSVFLTPDLKPFYAGTYFPPDDRYGRPGFPRLLRAIADAWNRRRDEVVHSAEQITQHLRQFSQDHASDGTALSEDLLRNALTYLSRVYDPTHGGFGTAPKFPHSMDVRLLLRLWRRFGSEQALHMARHTLEKMARGGMYDQLGGGFHRYSVDARWLVPHFEKMLYDNALLAVAYLEAFTATDDPFYAQIVRETLDYVQREMTSEPGGFYSTQDADSEGEEGKFFVWSKAELVQVLGADAEFACQVWDVTDEGNFEGHNILSRARSDEQEARLLGMDLVEFREKLADVRQRLFAHRERRVKPGRDEKILTAWNALMIAAFAQAGAVLEEPAYTQTAQRAAEFVLSHLRAPDGRLLRTCGIGQPAKLNGYLEDYANLTDALITLYETSFQPRWLRTACELADQMLARFADPAGGFFFTSDDHEELIVRTKETHDGSTPSGNSQAVTALLRLAVLTGREDYRRAAQSGLEAAAGQMRSSPASIGQMLLALDLHLGPIEEVVVVGSPQHPDYAPIWRRLRGKFRPLTVYAGHDPALGQPPAEIPLLAHRDDGGSVAVYVCRDRVCAAPLVGAEAVTQTLG